ncbi:MAG: ATP-binding protein [Gaiellaceae bacterium]
MSEHDGVPNAPSDAGADAANNGNRISGVRSGLLARIAVSFGGLAIGLAVVFVLLLVAVVGLRDRSLEARRSQQVIAKANGLETLVIDFESALRGYAVTQDPAYLRPFKTAFGQYQGQIDQLLRLTQDNREQHVRAEQIKSSIDSYVNTFGTESLYAFLLRNPEQAPLLVSAKKPAVQEIRGQFTRFVRAEEHLADRRDDRARGTAHTALVFGFVGIGAALLFLLAAGGYLQRAVAAPIRAAALAARRVAGGDLSVRLETRGPGEVGLLERAFNAMADSLQRSRDDLEERNRRLVESERLKTELVSNVSHELRTPLASILGFSDLMLKRDVEAGDRRRYLEVIRSESARLATLLNDLLDLQRHERGALELERDEIDLNDLLRVQVTLYSAQSEVHELAFRPSPDPLMVEADRDRLAQVVGNLISNAIKYSPNGGTVTVSSALGRGNAWVWVHDEGLGIPRDHQPQIFTKFFRGDAARKRGIAGTGLGLVLARQIVEAHDGAIGFDSEEGKGSTFWIRIPALAEASRTTRDDAEARHGM